MTSLQDVGTRYKSDCCSVPKPGALFHLLNLPREIRYLVLNQLLFRLEPLDFVNDPRLFRVHWQPPRLLWPEILASCKQLNAEGDPILYSNTLNVRISEAGCTILSPQYHAHKSWSNLPLRVR